MKRFVIIIAVFFIVTRNFAQVNDHCSNAILLALGNQCISTNVSTAGATEESDSVAPDPSCGSYSGGDIWYKVVMPASGGLRVEVANPQGAAPPSFTLYTGICGDLSEVVCVRNDRNKTVHQPALAGEDIYIRLYSYFGSYGSEFLLCAYVPEIPANDHCDDALMLEVGQSCNLAVLSNAYATAQPQTVAPDPSCESYQGGDVWFKTVMPASGVLRINKNRGSGVTAPSMTIYSGTCGNFTEVFCSENDPTETLNDPSLAGQTIYLRLYSYHNEEGATFSLCLYEEGAPQNDDCEDALSISAGDSCVFTTYSNRQATAQSSTTAANPSCGEYQGSDIWFKTVVPASGIISIAASSHTGSVPPSLSFYTGTCGNFEEVACMGNEKQRTLLNPAPAGETLYIRAYTYNSDDGKLFSLCVFEPQCVPDAVDLGTISICKGESYVFATQIITTPGQYSGVFQNITGCDSLVSLSIVVNTVNASVIQEGHTLTAQVTGATYQWIDCANGNRPIEGETGQMLTADTAGEYAVIVTENACTDTSDCHVIRITGLTGMEKRGFTVFPNPVGKFLNIELYNFSPVHLTAELTDVNGRIVDIVNFQDASIATVDVSTLPAGVYLVRIPFSEKYDVIKIIKM